MAAKLRVAVIGCGLIGRRRAEVVRRSMDHELVVVADVDAARAGAAAQELECLATTDWRAVVSRDDLDAVVVSTTNNWLAPITLAALEHGKHVLVEKPMARSPQEAQAIVQMAARPGSGAQGPDQNQVGRGAAQPVVAVGFNHRYHPAVWKAHALAAEGAIGEIISLRCRYGHGGRPGYGQEWRAQAEVSGGGELLDQGIHAVDLFRWFVGEFAEVCGFTGSYVWTAGTPVEDNGFALFRATSGQIASLHASWTQWRNLFSFEVFGRDGYLIAEGLGGSYGPERLTWGRRPPEGGRPDEEVFDFGGPDLSWQAEWDAFVGAIAERCAPPASSYDGWQAVRMIHAVYESARSGQVVRL